MKETIKHYFPLVLIAICALFAIYVIFHSITLIGNTFSNTTQKDNQTQIIQSIENQTVASLPTPHYTGTALTVGEGYAFHSLFEISGADNTTALYLVDVRSPGGNSILSKLSSTEIEHLEELPSTAIYDTEGKILYFHSSGIYTLLIRLYHNYRPGVLFECQIPVEVR